MSRPKLPNVSWRTCRAASAAVIAVLLTTACLVNPADAKPDGPPPQPVLTPSMTNLDFLLGSGHLKSVSALRQQAAAQAAAHRQDQAAAAAKRQAEALKRQAQAEAAAKRVSPPQHTEQRASRSAPRAALPAQTPTVAGAKNLARTRLSTTQYNCLDNLVRRESGWNHRATNPSSGAYGLMQALPGSKMASAGSDWRTNPLTQLKWGLSYIKSRYGTPCGAWNFWTQNGWY
ncbi:transglycosylase SLT domain-containing protein [Streptomyces sp. NPDC006632]|uniref:aggregation-promoting factor C-terminal-like domain-containing protein n=1 Tax=Streptomyces sp. NPDC006632 TaxID=3157182 RepID=UPI0033B3FCDC